MGKPFAKELDNIAHTLEWASTESVNPSLEKITMGLFDFPLFVVGSGGSLSCAHFIARLHEQATGKMSRAITPFDLLSLDVNPSMHGILFITAGGNNKDIINAVEVAIIKEFSQIAIFCSTIGSKIAALSNEYPYICLFEYDIPTGRDGFLAVNSLLSTCILFAKAYGAIDTIQKENQIKQFINVRPDFFNEIWEQVLNRRTIIALGGEWSWPVLIDLESKCTEAGLKNILIGDIKNFSHGRHNWFDKKGEESALLVFETPSMISLTKKIMALLPHQIPRALIKTEYSGSLATIALFVQLFHLVQRIGVLSHIDPGRPKVPEFGRKLYHMGLPLSVLRRKNNRDAWLIRKRNVSNYPLITLEQALDEFLDHFKHKLFSGVIFDYDGTLCDSAERFTLPKPEIASALNKLLSSDIMIGIATGRGGSVQRSLQEVIEKPFWSSVFVGNYNGSIISKLTDPCPQFDGNPSPAIQEACRILQSDNSLRKEIEIEPRSKQLSVTSKGYTISQALFYRIFNLLSPIEKIKIVQSSHSIDVLDADVSKVQVIESLKSILPSSSQNILIIGDQGQYNGNDFDLLNRPYGISVDKISPSLFYCWNLSPIGRRGADGMLAIIRATKIHDGLLYLNTELLEKEIR